MGFNGDFGSIESISQLRGLSLETIVVGSMVVDQRVGKKPTPGGAGFNVANDYSSLGGEAALLTVGARESLFLLWAIALQQKRIPVFTPFPPQETLPRCQITVKEKGQIEMEWDGRGIEDTFQEQNPPLEILHIANSIFLAIVEQGFALRLADKVKSVLGENKLIAYNPGGNIVHKTRLTNDILHLVDVSFFNADEASILLSNGIVNSLDQLVKKDGQIAVVTAGAQPTRIFSRDNDVTTEQRFSPPTIEPIDTTGAGDAFAATFMLAMKKRYPLDKGVELANLVAALITQVPSSTVTDEIVAKFQEEEKKLGLT